MMGTMKKMTKRTYKKETKRSRIRPVSKQRMGTDGTIYRSQAEMRFGNSIKSNFKKGDVGYEIEKFPLEIIVNYIPDFYLKPLNLWIEFKGVIDDDDRKKSTAFYTQVSERYIYVLQKPNVRMLRRKATNESFLSSVGIVYFYCDTAASELLKIQEQVARGKILIDILREINELQYKTQHPNS